MGGKDVVHLKQLHNSPLQPTEVQKLLKQLADERFPNDATISSVSALPESSGKTEVYRHLNSASSQSNYNI